MEEQWQRMEAAGTGKKTTCIEGKTRKHNVEEAYQASLGFQIQTSNSISQLLDKSPSTRFHLTQNLLHKNCTQSLECTTEEVLFTTKHTSFHLAAILLEHFTGTDWEVVLQPTPLASIPLLPI